MGLANQQAREMEILLAKQQGRYNARTGKIESEEERQEETMRLIRGLRRP